MAAFSVSPIVGGVAFAAAAAAACSAVRRPVRRTAVAWWATAGLGLAVNACYLGRSVLTQGWFETLRQAPTSGAVLAVLLAMVGVGVHLSAGLRGLDGLLLLVAAAVNLGVLMPTPWFHAEPGYQRWFVTHGLAFAASAACFVAGGLAGLGYLVIHRILRRKRGLALVGKLASLEALDRFGRWMLAIGFPLFTYGVLTGLCGVAHRGDIRRTAWYLDPVVLPSIAVWAVYGYWMVSTVIRPRVRGRRSAAVATFGMWLMVMAFLTLEFSSIHR